MSFFSRPAVMGVINVTPDSFSDGGVHADPEVAAAAARRMVEEGAAIVDVGGESTRPGSDGVPLDEELRRVEPVLERIARDLPVSIDTTKAGVARRALELGAVMVNDVSALRADPELAAVVAEHDAHLCLMHMQGEPRTMQQDPRYDDVVSEVAAFLEQRLRFAVEQGIDEQRICLDPGIGFGKTVEHNLELVRRLDVLTRLGRPVVIGFSRKSSLRTLTGAAQRTTAEARQTTVAYGDSVAGSLGGKAAEARQTTVAYGDGGDLLAASVAAAVAAYDRGASILRVHDVKPHVDALAVAAAVA